MPIELRDRVIAITGAGTGIGAATALACAGAGMHLALAGRRADKLELVAQQARALGVRALVVPMDVAQSGSAQRLVDETLRSLGGLYGVFANAGYGLEKPIHLTTDEELRAIFETNFFASVDLARAALPVLQSNNGSPRGHILLCSSCLARMPLPRYGAYSATKAAQHHLARAMRRELAPQRIEVSSVHPITTKTEFFDVVKNQSGAQRLTDHSPGWLAQDAATVARHTLACLRRPRAEVWTGAKGAFVRFGMSVCTFIPSLGDFVTRGMVE